MLGLIMIGGRGTRFWPMSRIKRPKQLIDFNGSGEMIKLTVDRLKPLIKPSDFIVVTSKNIVKPVKKILPEIKNIIGEPEGKNTAPCIAMITGLFFKEHKEKVMGVFPGDHFIANEKRFIDVLKKAENTAVKQNALVTIGIKPDSPNTGYGYIEYTDKAGHAYKVKKFYEKPDLQTARKFVKAGNFLWNAGIFVWQIKTIAEAFKKHQPLMYESILRISNASSKTLNKVISDEYKKMTKISIDYAIMELSANIFTIPAEFGWNDIGSWSSMASINTLDKNNNVIISKDAALLNSADNIVYCKNKMTALVNVNNLIIVEDNGCLLVCDKNSDQSVSEIVKMLEEKKKTVYL